MGLPRVTGVIAAAVVLVLTIASPLARQHLLTATARTVTTTGTLRLPGTPPAVPWPRWGQSALEVVGVGTLGATPDPVPAPVASVAKVMTAYLVLTDHPLAPGAPGPAVTVTAAEAAAYTREAQLGESHVPVRAGEVLTERQALEAVLLPSANNVARILARWDAGTVDAFVARMNMAASVLGMTGTHYTDPAGYDPGTVSTAPDQVVLAEHAMAEPAFAQLVAMRTAVIPIAGLVRNVNRLLGTDGVVGIKTGSTDQAGGCLLFAARTTVAGHAVTILGAVLGQDGLDIRGLGPTFTATRALVAAATRALGVRRLVTAGQVVTTVGGVNLAAVAPVDVLGWPGLGFTTTVTTTVGTGTATGTLVVTVGATRVTVALRAA